MTLWDNPDGDKRQGSVSWLVIALIVLWALLFAMRLLGPVDLVTKSQGLTLSYVVDILTNGSWITAQDNLGDPASKPPLHNWLLVVSVMAFGRNWFAVALPGALATLATVLWLVQWGSKHLGPRTGYCAGFVYLLSQLTVSLLPVARPDTLFTLCVAVAAGYAFEAWRGDRSWWPFWIWVTLAGLSKGPLGLVLAASGLTAALVMKSGEGRQRRSDGLWGGLLVFLAVNIGWFVAGWLTLGSAFVDEVLVEELVGHAVRNDRGDSLLATFWQPTAYLLGRFLPWSVILFWAIPRVVRRPAEDPREEALERFVTAWLVVGLLLFSFVGHKRADLIAPLVPPAALLVGRQLVDWTRVWSRVRLLVATVVTAAILCGAFTYYHHVVRARNPLIRLSAAQHAFAEELRAKVKNGQVFAYAIRSRHPQFSYIPQYVYGTLHRPITMDEAVNLLRGADDVWIVAQDIDELVDMAESSGFRPHILLTGDEGLALVSNRSHLP
jgi:4-amino-4-deoxy-L-arabinose transferase-like glycosyltransferase